MPQLTLCAPPNTPPEVAAITWRTGESNGGDITRFAIVAHLGDVPLILIDSAERSRWGHQDWDPDGTGRFCFSVGYESTDDGLANMSVASFVDAANLDAAKVVTAARRYAPRLIANACRTFRSASELNELFRTVRADSNGGEVRS